ncbi:MAG: hypothetical protein ACC631_00690 [Halocynthiibacter sp.]
MTDGTPMIERNGTYLMLVILIVAAPAVLANFFYAITKDPTLRPLAITRDAEAKALGSRTGLEIIAQINWGSNARANFSQIDLSGRITRAFYAHGESVRVEIQEVAGSDTITVTYIMGRNRFGPNPVANAADGIRAAIIAYRISVP